MSYTYRPAHPHAVTSAGGSYTYDENGNMITRPVNGQTYTLDYDAEGHLVSVTHSPDPAYSAQFKYDGDGQRVKSIINGVNIFFVGNYYEKTGSTISKYYYAGATRIGMRKYTIPQSMVVEYFLGDHLGSTSITTDNAGAKVSEMRYKPFAHSAAPSPSLRSGSGVHATLRGAHLPLARAGIAREVRYTWKDAALTNTTPAYALTPPPPSAPPPNATRLSVENPGAVSSSHLGEAGWGSGQFSYADDPSTPAHSLRAPRVCSPTLKSAARRGCYARGWRGRL